MFYLFGRFPTNNFNNQKNSNKKKENQLNFHYSNYLVVFQGIMKVIEKNQIINKKKFFHCFKYFYFFCAWGNPAIFNTIFA